MSQIEPVLREAFNTKYGVELPSELPVLPVLNEDGLQELVAHIIMELVRQHYDPVRAIYEIIRELTGWFDADSLIVAQQTGKPPKLSEEAEQRLEKYRIKAAMTDTWKQIHQLPEYREENNGESPDL